MKYAYSVSEKDFLNFQLYQLSKSEAFSGKLRKQRLVVALINVGLAIYFYADKHYPLSIAFLIVGALWYFVYPIRTKRIYKKRFEDEIRANLRDYFDVPAVFEIMDDSLQTSDKRGVSLKKFIDIKEISFIEDATFILFQKNQAFILSKELTENYDEMLRELKAKADQYSVIMNDDTDWEW